MKSLVMPFHRAPLFHNAPQPTFLTDRVEGYYQDRVQNTWGGGNIMRGLLPSQDAIHLCSNDYLSLSRHPKILKASAECLMKTGNGLLMSGVFAHGDNPLLNFEQRLANFLGAESGVLCQSGYAANTGLVQSIASESTPVYVDRMAHMPLPGGQNGLVVDANARAVAAQEQQDVATNFAVEFVHQREGVPLGEQQAQLAAFDAIYCWAGPFQRHQLRNVTRQGRADAGLFCNAGWQNRFGGHDVFVA